MVGQSGTQFVYHEDLDNTRNEMRTARRGGMTRNFDCRYVHKDGRMRFRWRGAASGRSPISSTSSSAAT